MRSSRKQERAVKTERSILKAASELFSSKGFQAVTMRQIADKAGCSHTAIYMYYKNKMSLLQELAVEPLNTLLERFHTVEREYSSDPDVLIKTVSLQFMVFAFENRSMYDLFFTTAGERVDSDEPEHEVNRLRIKLFERLEQALRRNIPSLTNKQALQHTRMLFYMLHGLIKTYLDSDEPTENLTERLTPILNEAVAVLLLGIRERHK